MKDKSDKASRRKSVAGWASNAVSSVTGRGKKDKETFAALRDMDGEDSGEDEREYTGSRPASAMSSSSRKSQQHRKSKSAVYSSSASPRPSIRERKSGRDMYDSNGKGDHKVVVALHDFAAGSTDELSFKAGDHITVLSEVLDGWWMGEVDGKRGLFPSTYTEVAKPALPQRPSARTLAYATPSSLDSSSPRSSLLGNPKPKIHEDMASDSEDHPFGDHLNVASYDDNNTSLRSPGIGQFWPDSASSGDDDDQEQLVRTLRRSFDDEPVSVSHIPHSPLVPPRRATTSETIKKPPPPPPPPRRSPNIAATSPSSSLSLSNPPPIPSRPPSLPSRSSAQSSSTSLVAITNTPSLRGAGANAKDDGGDDGLTYSPFENPRDIGELCMEFRQNPFKHKGFCSNCQQTHSMGV